MPNLPPNPPPAANSPQSPQPINIAGFSDLKQKIQTYPLTQLVDLIFAGAVSVAASDIHLEPEENNARLRFRVDGVLQDIAVLPKQNYLNLRDRIKFLAKLKTNITDTPQDGRFEQMINGQKVDFRVSSIPTNFGEAIEMRLLIQTASTLKLEQLGFSPEDLKKIQTAVIKPNGMILNTGPTGSGKTTTLYSILSVLNQPGRKIVTLEDPIEYELPGINQSQIEPESNYDFVAGLRSVLWQDPDVIMIGEIRDIETAKTALSAAVTGHLVLTTLHTNDATSALPRLLDMGIEPYLLSGSINLIIAQRLVRKIHRECAGKGCEICNHTGYKGRTVIAETLTISEKIEALISRKASLSEFREAAKAEGMKTMYDDGLAKVAAGITTKDEVERVTKA